MQSDRSRAPRKLRPRATLEAHPATLEPRAAPEELDDLRPFAAPDVHQPHGSVSTRASARSTGRAASRCSVGAVAWSLGSGGFDVAGNCIQQSITRHDLLAGTFMIRVLPPWFEDLGKRLVKSPKVYPGFLTKGVE